MPLRIGGGGPIATFDQWLEWNEYQWELSRWIRAARQEEKRLAERSAFYGYGVKAFLRHLWVRIKEFAASLTGGSKHRA